MTIHNRFARRRFILLLVAWWPLALGAGSTFAQDQTKSFAFGPGTPHVRSDLTTFAVPCNLHTRAVVTYSREGAAGARNDVPIVIELRQPSATGEDGELAAELRVTATTSRKTQSLDGSPLNRGCSKPWRVRVKHAAESDAPNKVSGTILFAFGGALSFEMVGARHLHPGATKTVNIGPPTGMLQGEIEVTGIWEHSLFGQRGPLPVKLKFELIDNTGTVVQTASGYASNDINPAANPKFKLTKRISSCQGGQWTVRITNESPHDVMNLFPKGVFRPSCAD